MIPLWKPLVPWLFGLFLLNWLIDADFSSKFTNFTLSKERQFGLLLPLLFILYVISLFWTEHFNPLPDEPFSGAWFDLQLKAPLILGTLVFLSASWMNKETIKRYFIAFILGCFACLIIDYAVAFQKVLQTGKTHWFFYSYLSLFHHPSYMAVYVNVALFYLVQQLLDNKVIYGWGKFYTCFGILFFSTSVFLLTSRAGLLSFFIGILVLLTWLITVKRNVKIVGFIVAILLLFGVGVLSNKNYLRDRLYSTWNELVLGQVSDYQKKHYYSVSDRTHAWKASMELIAEHPWLGVGAGDVRSELDKKYKDNLTDIPMKKYLNSHNQFLQTWLAAGILAALLLFLMIIGLAIKAFRQKLFFPLVVMLTILINYFTESMLETQDGVAAFLLLFVSVIILTEKNTINLFPQSPENLSPALHSNDVA